MTQPRHTFPPSRRLSGKLAFRRVFDASRRAHKFPLTVWVCDNELGHPRLGLSIGKKIGHAPRRSRLKRKLREAFRLTQHDLPPVDLVITGKPHDDLPLETYVKLLPKLAARAVKGPRR